MVYQKQVVEPVTEIKVEKKKVVVQIIGEKLDKPDYVYLLMMVRNIILDHIIVMRKNI